jgi:DNA-binding NarL/FixJ family response regulator
VTVNQIRVALHTTDTLTEAGLTSLVENQPDITLVEGVPGQATADVRVVAVKQLTTQAVSMLRQCNAEAPVPVVLISDDITKGELLTAVDCRVVAILPRGKVTAERLLHSITTAASGGGVMPPSLVGELLKHIERLQRSVLTANGLNVSALTSREVAVLRLMADGLDTSAIAVELSYSERTVKNVVHGITRRLNVRNRSHAVAYGLRTGII